MNKLMMVIWDKAEHIKQDAWALHLFQKRHAIFIREPHNRCITRNSTPMLALKSARQCTDILTAKPLGVSTQLN